MSTILDALKKLESEKAEARRASEATLEQGIAEEDLFGSSHGWDLTAARISPGMLLLGALVIAGAAVTASVGTALVVIQSQSPSQTVSAQSTAPAAGDEQAQVVQAAGVSGDARSVGGSAEDAEGPAASQADADKPATAESGTSPQGTSEASAESSQQTAEAGEQASGVSSEDAIPSPKAPPRPEERPSADKEAPIEWAKVAPPPSKDSAKSSDSSSPASGKASAGNDSTDDDSADQEVVAKADTPGASNEADSGGTGAGFSPGNDSAIDPGSWSSEDDLSNLPILNAVVKKRHGLDGLVLRMPRPKIRQDTRASAVMQINDWMAPVYIGEPIRDTSAVLIGVEHNGVGIEITATGSKYYLPFR